jgi:hypothetical protein
MKEYPKSLLVCECSNFADLASTHPTTLSILKKDITLNGFALVLSLSSLLNHNSIIHSFAVRNESTSILACSVVISSSTDPLSIKLATQIDSMDHVHPFSLHDGILLVGEPDAESGDTLRVPNGDYEAHVPILIRNINLKRLGVEEVCFFR